MPIYEYVCKNCRNEFETLVLNSDDEIACSECGSTDIEKRFSTFGFKSKSSIPVSSTPESPSGCGCTPVGCGCSARH
ncbi:MAG TPA: zinc ribbon domain-containing protein [Thermodesulfobacteriota bacterium]|nr:zinc ribbon domain-containing protein [Thermodesulfobacteriota bacterium]